MDPEISAELSNSAAEESDRSNNATSVLVDKVNEQNSPRKEEKAVSVSASATASNLGSGSTLIQGDEIGIKREDSGTPSSIEVDEGRKSSSHSKTPPGKRKVKVDWTPELHRQFVQAVEQLGVDKAVPSKILELMGIDCLTRHNVASHLQKYRSHRKHLLAREAQAASWRRRRESYGSQCGAGRRELDSWVVPTTGFPPVAPMPQFRPLHVWGHPSVNQSLMYMWPQPPPTWGPAHHPAPVTGDPNFWYYHHQDVPAPGMPCFLPNFPATGFPAPPVQGITPTSIYRGDPGLGVPTVSPTQMLQPPYDFHLSKESVDRVIGDVLSKPWLPLPLGLKPPSTDSVIMELHRQGISKIPPSIS